MVLSRAPNYWDHDTSSPCRTLIHHCKCALASIRADAQSEFREWAVWHSSPASRDVGEGCQRAQHLLPLIWETPKFTLSVNELYGNSLLTYIWEKLPANWFLGFSVSTFPGFSLKAFTGRMGEVFNISFIAHSSNELNVMKCMIYLEPAILSIT